MKTLGSHKGECASYARSVAERDSWTSDPDEVDQIAAAYLSDSTVSCICDGLCPLCGAGHTRGQHGR